VEAWIEVNSRGSLKIRSIAIPALFYLHLLALFCKYLIINGAGEGNRTLVSGLEYAMARADATPLLCPMASQARQQMDALRELCAPRNVVPFSERERIFLFD